MREDVYRDILTSRILNITNQYTKAELEEKRIDQIEMILYDHKVSTYISEEEVRAYEANK